MPHLRMRALTPDHVASLSQTLCQPLAAAMATSEDNFTFEAIPTTFFAEGNKTNSYPFIEVLWFERPQEVQNQAARIITEQVKALTQAADVVVVFIALNRQAYYENGEHF